MPAEQPLFPMGPPMLSSPRPEGVLELSWLQWSILLGSVAVFAMVVTLVVVRIVRQRRQPLLHSADERLLRERGASAELTAALGALGRQRALGRISEADYSAERARLLARLDH